MKVFAQIRKTFPQLRPSHNPWQLDLRHNIHPTQRAGEDWERGAGCNSQECQNLQRKHQELPLSSSRVGR